MLSKLSDMVLRIDDPDDGRTRQQLIDIRQKWGEVDFLNLVNFDSRRCLEAVDHI